MVYLDMTATRELLELLAPLMQGEGERRALLIEALGVGCPVLNRIEFGGAVSNFLPKMIGTLAKAGEIEPGTTALWALLETARRQVGLDIQKRIDTLKSSLESSTPKTAHPATAAPVAQPLHLKVFLASPGDVADKRTLALSVLGALQYEALATALEDRRASDLEMRLCTGTDAVANLVGDLLKDKNADAELLLFVDQLEELFTLVDYR